MDPGDHSADVAANPSAHSAPSPLLFQHQLLQFPSPSSHCPAQRGIIGNNKKKSMFGDAFLTFAVMKTPDMEFL